MTDNNNWYPKLKNYPHFDAPISKESAFKLATDPEQVKNHQFFPFLSRKMLTRKFGSKKAKERLIRYGARKDAYIYSYYRKILMDRYDPILERLGLNECVIAYRHLTYERNGKRQGKCNIDFAKEAFDEIAGRENCIAITLDISGFFESLDHKLIKQKWCQLLGVNILPEDHYRVYRNITNYKVVELDECYKRLGLMTIETVGGKQSKKYKFSRKDQSKQLCRGVEFQNKIAGYDTAYESLIQGNPYKEQHRGIPQGSPISDVIANMYMLDFDVKMKVLADKIGGYYRRYSDDILLILPAGIENYNDVINQIKQDIECEGDHLKIKDSKTIITRFSKAEDKIAHESFDAQGKPKNNAFEYLGFGFDGKRRLLKSQALTRYYKNMHRGINAAAKTAADKAEQAGSNDLLAYLNISALYHRYSNPNRGLKNRDGKKASNFITYAQRSKRLMDDEAISHQLRKHKKILLKTLRKAVNKFSPVLLRKLGS